MKRALIITHAFAQKERVGAIRAWGLAKFLKRYGWDPTVLTVASPTKYTFECDVLAANGETEHEKWKRILGLRREAAAKEQLHLTAYEDKGKKSFADYVFNLWGEIFTYPDVHKNWGKAATNIFDELLANEGIEALISSSPPVRAHLIASGIKSKYKIPWIADFRDLWTQNANYRYSGLRRHFERKLEARTISDADILTTVSHGLAEKLRLLHKEKEVRTISNGFDPEQVNQGSALSDTLTITYTGKLYQKQNPELLLAALKEMLAEGTMECTDISVNFFGQEEARLANEIKKYELQGVVKQNGPVSRETAVQLQHASQLLLLLTWNDPNESGIITGKIFDYMAAQRPILSIGTFGGEVEKILQTTKAGVHLPDVHAVKRELKKNCEELTTSGKVSYEGITYEIDKFSQKEMAKQFVQALEDIT